MKKDSFDKHVPEDMGTALVSVNIDGRSMAVPGNFNLEFIVGELIKVQKSPSMIENYFRALRTKFNLKQQIGIINMIEKQMRSVSQGLSAQIDFVNLQREYQLALKGMSTIEDDHEIRQLQKELEKEDLRLGLARKKKEREELEKKPEPQKPPKSRQEQREEELNNMREETRHRTEKEFVREDSKFEKGERIREERDKRLRECDEKYKINYGVKDVADLDEEALKKWKAERRSINNHFDKMGMNS